MPPRHIVRLATDADLPAAVTVRARANPDRILTEDGMRLWLAEMPERAVSLQLAVDVDGRLAGWATATRMWMQSDLSVGMLDVVVDPVRQGTGIGAALVVPAEAHLREHGLTTVKATSLDSPANRAFAARLGFVQAAGTSTSSVDPRTVVPMPVPEDVRLVPFGELTDPRPVYELDLEASRDIPGEQDFDAMSLAEWSARFWRSPLVDDDCSLVAHVCDELAGLTMLRVDRPSGRAQNNLTAVRRGFRGRGLSRVLKSHSLAQAAVAGATVAVTDNDETNAPMLAVNAALGYQPFVRRVEWVRRGA